MSTVIHNKTLVMSILYWYSVYTLHTGDQMARTNIPVLDLEDYLSDDLTRKSKFVEELGEALIDIGFFSLTNHGIDLKQIDKAYAVAEEFFALPTDTKAKYENKDGPKQRGHIPFGIEAAKGFATPDLKEFWQTGRRLSADNPHVESIPPNIWPDEDLESFRPAIDGLYKKMDNLGVLLLEACALYLQKDKNWFVDMAQDGNTILRVIHYPPISPDADPNAVRAAQHEDINFITLLVGATADGLEVMDHDGEWIPVQGKHDHIIVDTGDMIQNITNGLYKAITHRVVNPTDAKGDRYSMPLFVHPRPDVDLSPRPEFFERTGGEAKYPNISAGDYLEQRLREIGLQKD